MKRNFIRTLSESLGISSLSFVDMSARREMSRNNCASHARSSVVSLSSISHTLSHSLRYQRGPPREALDIRPQLRRESGQLVGRRLQRGLQSGNCFEEIGGVE